METRRTTSRLGVALVVRRGVVVVPHEREPAGRSLVTAFRDAFPIVYVDDVEDAIRFYTEALGCELRFRWPPDHASEPTFAFLGLDPLGVGVAARRASEHNAGADFELCVYTDDAAAAAARLRSTGAEEVLPPQDEPWGERRAYFRNPDGTLLHIAQKL